MIDDIDKKKKTSSREELLNNLNKKLEQSNTSDHTVLLNYKEDALNKNILFDETTDPNNLTNVDADFKKSNTVNKDFSRKAYVKELKEVIENADVILEVLDARDPMSCRSKELERTILNHKDEKKIILILNKIDLIPLDNAILWKKYLKREFPTILFKANTQNQNSNLSSASVFNTSMLEKKDFIEEMLNSNKAIGGENLLNLLKNYCRVEDTKKTITVGIVGFPNVGKSSIINSLKRGKVVGVSSTPGHTKAMQEIILDKNIKLLDCPGVVFSNNLESGEKILHNVIRIEDIKDPVEVVNLILKKVSLETFSEVYQLNQNIFNNPENCTVEKILYLIGDKFKKYKKGGIVDMDKTARLIVKDWNDGKLKYFSMPENYEKIEGFLNNENNMNMD